MTTKQQWTCDPVRGFVCSHCGHAIPIPFPDRLGKVSAFLVNDAITEMTRHITTEHWLQNIPGTPTTETL